MAPSSRSCYVLAASTGNPGSYSWQIISFSTLGKLSPSSFLPTPTQDPSSLDILIAPSSVEKMFIVLLWHSVVTKHSDQEQLLGGKCLPGYISRSQSHTERSQHKDLSGREEHCLLASFLGSCLANVFIQLTCLSMATPEAGWALLFWLLIITTITHPQSYPRTELTAQLGLSPQVTLGGVKWTIKANQDIHPLDQDWSFPVI